MGQKIHTKHWTNADWFSFAGFIVYLMLATVGLILKRADLAMSFFFASLLAVGAWGMLALLKKLKKVEENIQGWRPIEYLLCVFAFLVLLFGINMPMYWALSTVVVDSDTLKEAANDDISCMRALFADYEKNETDDIEKTHTALLNHRQRQWESSTEFNNILACHFETKALTQQQVDEYRDNILYQKYLSGKEDQRHANNLEGDYQTFKESKMEVIMDIEQSVSTLNFIQIPQLVIGPQCIERTGEEIATVLTNKSKARSENGYPFKFDRQGTPLERDYTFHESNESLFKKGLNEMLGYKFHFFPTLLGLLVNILMLLSYFMSKRSAKVEIARGKNKIHIGEGITFLDDNN